MTCQHRYVTTHGKGWYCCSCRAPMLSLAVQIFGKPPVQPATTQEPSHE